MLVANAAESRDLNRLGRSVATGQDPAQVVESSSAFTRAESSSGDLYFSVRLPNLELGTVGGGTEYGTARTCLKMLKCAGPGEKPGDNAKKLAEITGASVTAQELNLLGALASGNELANAHYKHARKRRVPQNSYNPGRSVWGMAKEYGGLIVDVLGAPWGISGSDRDGVRQYQDRVGYRIRRIRAKAA